MPRNRAPKKIHPDNWSVRHFKSGTGLQVTCPTHSCGAEIVTQRKPSHFGLLLIDCAACCTRHTVTLTGWHKAPPLRDHTPTDPTDTKGT